MNIIAHSMGGLIVREAVQMKYRSKEKAEELINKIVTLGTPHRGIAFQILRNWIGVEASEELEFFNPEFQETDEDRGYKEFARFFDRKRLLCVVGTFRLDFYVGERDLFGIGFSDNVVFRKQYYIRAILDGNGRLTDMWRHSGEEFALPNFTPKAPNDQKMKGNGDGWWFDIGGSGFEARLLVEIDAVPADGDPVPVRVPAED